MIPLIIAFFLGAVVGIFAFCIGSAHYYGEDEE